MSSIFIRKFTKSLSTDGPISDLSFVIKDNISLAPMPTSWGISPPAISQAQQTATVIQQLLEGGATCRGATNLEPYAIGADGKNPFYGNITLNTGETAFGSSGGVAIAIREFGMDFGVATDIGGSCRLPALATGAIGLKFKSSELSHEGVLRFHPKIDCLGMLAKDLSTAQRLVAFLTAGTEREEKGKFFLLTEDAPPQKTSLPSISLSDILPNAPKIRTLHQQIIAKAITEQLEEHTEYHSPQIAALQKLHAQNPLSEEIANPLREWKEQLLSLHPTPIFCTPISLPIHSLQAFPFRPLLLANLLDWSALVIPQSKEYALHYLSPLGMNELLSLVKSPKERDRHFLLFDKVS
jgi:Asp-tRNA(Asn)/Glu-tRNA(Gln) amidotransferase A subunit family amidase